MPMYTRSGELFDEVLPPWARQNQGRSAGGVDVLGSSKKELMDRAAKLGIRGRSNMSKQELGEAIVLRSDGWTPTLRR